jgi:hypothetical protein
MDYQAETNKAVCYTFTEMLFEHKEATQFWNQVKNDEKIGVSDFVVNSCLNTLEKYGAISFSLVLLNLFGRNLPSEIRKIAKNIQMREYCIQQLNRLEIKSGGEMEDTMNSLNQQIIKSFGIRY